MVRFFALIELNQICHGLCAVPSSSLSFILADVIFRHETYALAGLLKLK